MKKNVYDLKSVFVFIVKLMLTIFVLGILFFGPIILYWNWEENKNIKECVQNGETYEKCYELYNW